VSGLELGLVGLLLDARLPSAAKSETCLLHRGSDKVGGVPCYRVRAAHPADFPLESAIRGPSRPAALVTCFFLLPGALLAGGMYRPCTVDEGGTFDTMQAT